MKKINAIIKKIEQFKNIAIFTHVNIDGDSYSSSYGLALAIKEKYPDKKVKVFTDFEYLKSNFPFLEKKASMFSKKVNNNTLGIVGDVAIKNRIQYFSELEKCKEIICFDHHQNEIDFKTNIYWREPEYSASSLQAAEITFTMLKKITENTALALLFGILTDTGFFKYSTNKTHAPLLYSKLLAFTSHEKMNKLFVDMNIKTKEGIAIQKYIYTNIKYKKNVAYVVINKQMVKKYKYSQLKLKIYSIANIEGFEYWAFFIETNKNGFRYKVSLRTSIKNVNVIAQKHHGGGHIKASGCYAKDDKEILEIVNDMTKL